MNWASHVLLLLWFSVTPHTQCRLKLLKQERIKDYLLMEEEFIRNQEQMKPLEEKQEVSHCFDAQWLTLSHYCSHINSSRSSKGGEVKGG